jgi:hypothetical protein
MQSYKQMIRFGEVRNCACHFSAWREMMTNHGTAVDAVVAGCSECETEQCHGAQFVTIIQ